MRAGGGIGRLCRTGAAAAAAVLSACTVGPDYQRPIAPVPADYKEAAAAAGLEARPAERYVQPRRLVGDLQRPGARRAGAADRHLEPEPQSRRGGFAPGRRDRRRGPRRLFPDRNRRTSRPSARAAAAAPRAAPVRRPLSAAAAAGSEAFSATRWRRAGLPICGARSAARSRPMSPPPRRAPPISPMRGSRRRARSPATICNCASPTN